MAIIPMFNKNDITVKKIVIGFSFLNIKAPIKYIIPSTAKLPIIEVISEVQL